MNLQGLLITAAKDSAKRVEGSDTSASGSFSLMTDRFAAQNWCPHLINLGTTSVVP